MKARAMALILAFCLIASVCVAQDAHMGTWKLNESKSKIPQGMPKNDTVIYAADGENVKITVHGVDSTGKPAHNEWTGKFDGKDYPVTGDPMSDARSYTKVDDNTLHAVNKKAGKVTAEIHIVVSADGKTRTVTSSRTDEKGNKAESVSVYEKQ